VVFSVFGGIQQFGFLGMIMGSTVVALAFVALDVIKEKAAQDAG